MRDLGDIEELIYNEECIIPNGEKIENLRNSEAINDRDASVNIKKELQEHEEQLTKLTTEIHSLSPKWKRSIGGAF